MPRKPRVINLVVPLIYFLTKKLLKELILKLKAVFSLKAGL
jgi:hypothetical protein